MNPNISKHFSAKNIALWCGVLLLLLVAWTFVSSFLGNALRLKGVSGMDSATLATAPMMGAPQIDSGTRNMAQGVAYDYSESVPSERMMMPSPMPEAPALVSQIIRSAELALVVDDVDASVKAIEQIRVEFGGQVGTVSVRDYATARYGEMTIWIPSASFDVALERIKKTALRVSSVSVNATDVSAQFVDLDARLKNLKATEEQYMQIMKRSGTIADVLAVQQALSETRQSIEQIEGQMQYLSRQVALSSVHITLTQEVASVFTSNEWRPWSVVKNAFRDTSRDFTKFVDSVLVLIVKLPMFLLQLAFWGGIIYAVFRFARKLYFYLRRFSLPNGGGKV